MADFDNSIAAQETADLPVDVPDDSNRSADVNDV